MKTHRAGSNEKRSSVRDEIFEIVTKIQEAHPDEPVRKKEVAESLSKKYPKLAYATIQKRITRSFIKLEKETKLYRLKVDPRDWQGEWWIPEYLETHVKIQQLVNDFFDEDIIQRKQILERLDELFTFRDDKEMKKRVLSGEIETHPIARAIRPTPRS